MIHVIAAIEVVEGKRDDFLSAFHDLVPLVHAEAGCIEYGPAVDVASSLDVQQPPQQNVVVVIEKWESIEALDAHLKIQHMLDFREKVGDLVLDTKIRILEPA